MSDASLGADQGLVKPRRPWLAFILGLFSPGLGHVYAGKPWRGIAAFAILLLLILPLGSFLLVPFLGSPARMLQGCILRFGLPFLVPLHGAITAFRHSGESLTRWNRVWVYASYGVATTLVLVFALPHLVPLYPVRMRMIPYGAMEPALWSGDTVLVDTIHDGSSSLEAGSIIVFEHPEVPGNEYAKRLIGLPGQKIEMRNDVLFVDDRAATVELVDEAAGRIKEVLGKHTYEIAACPGCNWGPYVVPEGSVFVLGDNRGRSADSRVYGPVPISKIRGRVLGVAWSIDADGELRWERLGKRL